MRQTNPLKRTLKWIIRSSIYRFPPVYLSPGGLYLWFDAIRSTSEDGDVLEVGCYLGATAAMSCKFLKEIGSERQYSVIDTFNGFVEEQFDSEVAIGGTASLRHEFSGNTPELTRWVMDKHGGSDVKMIVGDIATLPDSKLPERISACLLDVDLADPIYAGMTRIYPRLVPGGVIIVDDCSLDGGYKARVGYERFMTEHGFASEIRYGKGIVRK